MARQGQLTLFTKTTNFLNNKGINFEPKEVNPTEVPQCRSIENFFGVLATHVYARNWTAGDAEALKRRIRACAKKEIALYLPHGASECLPLTFSVQNCPNFNNVSLILTTITTEFIDPIKGSEISSIFCNHPLRICIMIMKLTLLDTD